MEGREPEQSSPQVSVMQVKDVMVRDVKTIEKGSSLQDAAKKMTELRIGSLIVVNQKQKMMGIITESDILKIVGEGKKTDGLVETTMTKEVFYVKPEDDVLDAVDIMLKNKIKKLPVISGGALVGIITITDIATAEPKLLEQLSQLMLFGQRQKFVAG